MNKMFVTLLALSLMAAFLMGCSRQPTEPAPMSEAESPLAYADMGLITATGVVVPSRHQQLSFPVNGQIKDLTVKVGDTVQAGQVLAQLDGRESREADIAAAELAVLNAQQALDDLNEDAAMARALAESDVAAAKKVLEDARRHLKNLNQPDLDWYQEQVDQAQEDLATAEENAVVTDIGSLSAALQAARDALKAADDRLGKITAAINGCPECDPTRQVTVDGYAQTLDDAQDAYNDAANAVKELEIQIAQAERGNTNALEDAQEELNEAQEDLAAAQRGPKLLDVEIAQANVTVAEAALAEAETRLVRLQSGPDPDQLEAAQARLIAAQTSLTAAQVALEQAALLAPYSGVVSNVMLESGEAVAAGMPVLELIDTHRWRIETKDVGELMIGRVKVGQPVTATINAFPGEEITGTVVAIAPTAIVQLGDTTYAVTVELEPAGLDLRWGMTARVDIQTER